jgi:uncharacterized cupredoxin-like copper-binding protein
MVGTDHMRNLPRLTVSLMLVFCAATVLTLLASCGSSGQSSSSQSASGNTQTTATRPIPAITIKAVDFSFDEPQTVQAGLVDVKFVNTGKEPHQINIGRLNDGVTFDQFKTALDDKNKGPGAALGLATLYGGANTVSPGETQEVILNFPAGQYVSICFIAGADNVPHYMKGMLTQFTVTGSPGKQDEPKADGNIMLQDFSFALPSSIQAGPLTLKVTNNGPQPHEVAILKLAKGVTMQKLLQLLSQPNPPAGPPPFQDAGGLGALKPGSSAWLKLNLQPGNYGTVCFVPDPKTGKPHVMLGMSASFTVK